MLLLKPRVESNELLAMRSLNARTDLSENEKFYYQNLEKGYEGEVKFDQLVEENLLEDCFVINDLLLEVGHSLFQIDTIIISQNIIHLIDVKNFTGDYKFRRYDTVQRITLKATIKSLSFKGIYFVYRELI